MSAVGRVVDDVVLDELIKLAASETAESEVRAMALLKLTDLRSWLARQSASVADDQQRAHIAFAAAQIRRFEQQPGDLLKPTKPGTTPPGQPIGSMDNTSTFAPSMFACGEE